MQEIVAIDFESTGSSPGFNNTPWQIGMVLLRNGKLCPDCHYSSLLKVPEEQPFNPYTPGRWAALRKELAQAPSLLELWPVLQTWFSGRILLAHNVPVERNLLKQSFPFHHFGPWLDTLVLARLAFPGQITYKLEDLTANLGLSDSMASLCPDSMAHDALYDALACGKLLQLILTEPTWRQASLESLSTLKAGKGSNGFPPSKP
ncbi:MAG: 3'-5' exonuclease [Lentisphaeria bacterium]